ncbi:retroviral-like aspartic protease family protein [Lederbergia sp. NSJ-179]|uniref:retropepsin-like aspartic protease n=1 Tax=Lederbergia sp. NSJ-179 TaxID=2931402 RepID=UPI001FD06909|nr:retropepsin-like aspartic protease [Lederbergia sp. NSJ-179]MCJ7842162.1 retroviral-like aspartic protease family protein [Lederbergia sp. NSJ-179]
MKLEIVNRLLEVEMTISYKGKTKIIDKLIIDTGAAHTLISSDVVEDIGIFFENEDSLVSAYGIGGEEYSFRKPVDYIKLGTHEIPEMKLDFGNLDDWGINGLIGLDILMNGKFTIDLEKLELVQNH